MKLFVMCFDTEACLPRNLVHVCPNPARKNSGKFHLSRGIRGPEPQKVCFSHSRALGEVRGPGPERWLWTFQVFSPRPRWHVFINTRNASKRHSPSTFLFFLWASIHHSTNQRCCTVTAPPPPQCGMGTQSAALATVSTTAAWGNCGRHLHCPKM